MSTSLAYTLLAFLVSSAFTLATLMQPRLGDWSKRGEAGLLKVVFGEGRRLFANQFFVQADVYFHSGYYPSIFDRSAKSKDSSHMRPEEGMEGEQPDEHGHHDHDSEHSRQMDAGKARDWVEAFGRRFMLTQDTHLSGGNQREMLPWLKLSAEMDPQRVETYAVAAFWLRDIGKVREAEDFLRLGLRNNPKNYELLFELGRLMEENRKDDNRARNLWKLALTQWEAQEQKKKDESKMEFERIVVRLARLEEREGNLGEAIRYLEMAAKVAPDPKPLLQKVQALQGRL